MNIDLFEQLLNSFDKILYKTLSANDYKWANVPNIHQAGVLVNKELDSFFPPVDYNQDIFTQEISTFWIENGEWIRYPTQWKYYASKNELRLTRVSKEAFRGISPASLLLIGKKENEYFCYIVDSDNIDEYEYALNLLEIREAPRWGIVTKVKGLFIDEDTELDRLFQLPEGVTSLPKISDLSQLALDLYSRIHNGRFEAEMERTPGDFIDNLILFEYKIYKKYEAFVYSNILAKNSEPDIYNVKSYPENFNFYRSRIDSFSSTFVGMLNSRKSRVGKTFEYHVRDYFDKADIKYDYQVQVDGKKKPDFIIPSKEFYYSRDRKPDDAILLSLKTTVRERWQQILNEGKSVKTRYLATLDKTVTKDQLTEMADKNVVLIVTEWAKKNNEIY